MANAQVRFHDMLSMAETRARIPAGTISIMVSWRNGMHMFINALLKLKHMAHIHKSWLKAINDMKGSEASCEKATPFTSPTFLAISGEQIEPTAVPN